MRLLEAHPEAGIRAAAAVAWAAAPHRWPDVGTVLSNDPIRVVRQSLAAGASNTPHHAAVVAALKNDPRRSVRQQLTAALQAEAEVES